MRVARAVNNLVEAFEKLPGIGPKSAQRLTYYLLHVPQTELDKFASALSSLKTGTKECAICHNIAETDPCDICADPNRNPGLICVVEQPLDVLALERANGYRGTYHVLHGVIDPLHNIGPDEIKIGELLSRINTQDIKEIVLALNPNMEGEATCMYLVKQIKSQSSNLKITRLAHGLPMGADIEYADEVTLGRAMEGRREY
jgi:recombination protein RecR